MGRVYTIMTPIGKFSIDGFTQTVVNTSGSSYVKYHSENGGIFYWSFLDTKDPTSFGFTKNFRAYPGDEIIVIGDSIHFNTDPTTGFPNQLHEFMTNILKK
ncbi:hypothetical protein EZ456_07440 [Pedobacter psychrodurus]|uniref:Uncharacterized protein n=1 Tax=Pedobacter psychrodurus TaxID=2530456 RepID=A0A4R0PXW7_9SPHI|nr:hypothetical protein [Pedobacter psychrodurus]TCD27773.1 hypothetical protein EZ456_07440 [Pedobacter psychrodurus]